MCVSFSNRGQRISAGAGPGRDEPSCRSGTRSRRRRTARRRPAARGSRRARTARRRTATGRVTGAAGGDLLDVEVAAVGAVVDGRDRLDQRRACRSRRPSAAPAAPARRATGSARRRSARPWHWTPHSRSRIQSGNGESPGTSAVSPGLRDLDLLDRADDDVARRRAADLDRPGRRVQERRLHHRRLEQTSPSSCSQSPMFSSVPNRTRAPGSTVSDRRLRRPERVDAGRRTARARAVRRWPVNSLRRHLEDADTH